MKHKFWKFCRNEDSGGRELQLKGVISDETWYGDEVTPGLFRDELNAGDGDITVWIDSPGGDCFKNTRERLRSALILWRRLQPP